MQIPIQKEITRRKFLTSVIGAVAVVVGVGTAVPVVGYLLSPAWRKITPTLTPVARMTDIPVGKPTFVTYEQRVRDGWVVTTLSKGAWLMTKDGKQFVAYDPRCTHLNCPYYWNSEKNIFECPCHDGRYDIDGIVLHGPPPRPLDRLQVKIEGVEILVGERQA